MLNTVFQEDGKLTHILQSREGDSCAPFGSADIGVFLLTVSQLKEMWNEYLSTHTKGGITQEINFLPFLSYLSQQANWRVCPVRVDDPAECLGINTPEDLDLFKKRRANLCLS